MCMCMLVCVHSLSNVKDDQTSNLENCFSCMLTLIQAALIIYLSQTWQIEDEDDLIIFTAFVRCLSFRTPFFKDVRIGLESAVRWW